MSLKWVATSALAFAPLLAGCGGASTESLADKARVEGQASTEGGIQAENERVKKMEDDLARRHRFYQSVKGTYEGSLTTDSGSYRIRLTLVPSLAPFPVDRVRTVEEVSSDLTNLYFRVQVIQWNPDNVLSSVGCRVEAARPDLAQGELSIASEECPNFYSLRLGDRVDPRRSSGAIAVDAIEGRLSSVTTIRGEVRPSTVAAVYTFSATRVSGGGGQ